MALNFAVEIKPSCVFYSDEQRIDCISAAGEIIGYISVNKADGNTTAFNAAGSISDAHCPNCALRTLFAWKTGLDADAVQIASDENPAAVVMSAIISAAIKH
ncbi:hypothetical protein [Pantoea ananatis]|uniref:hypothetical protein n=1 Tax=Pantoea ananas TaxID=553 RepID=UPI0025CB556B|nr:hypothetical protein [Pantoea ananatis]MDN4128262.1 hypothetical protein [Pantoea ananatis]MDN4152554.1 hypothetical protein [Pantoea ananatis]